MSQRYARIIKLARRRNLQQKLKTVMPINRLDDGVLKVVVADTSEEGAKRSRWKNSEPSYECSFGKVEKIKSMFRDEINSQRVFERIHTLAQLLRILERRDSLGPEHFNNLIRIINEVAPHDEDIKNILYDPVPVANKERVAHLDNRVLPLIPPTPVERVNEMVKNNIGAKWKELARFLGIQEGQIDRLEYKYRGDILEMTHEILRSHQERYGSNYEAWRAHLQQALSRARRVDLSENVDEILMM